MIEENISNFSDTSSRENNENSVTLSELANSLGNSSVQLQTKKKRIRKIIEELKIKIDTSAKPFEISEIDAQRIKEAYLKRWSLESDKKASTENFSDEQLKFRLEDKTRDLIEAKNMISELTTKNSRLEDQLIKKDEKYDDLLKKLADSIKESHILVQNQQKITAKDDERAESLSSLAQSLVDSNRRLSDSQRQVSDQQSKILDQTNELNNLKLEKEAKEKEVEKLKAENEQLKHKSFFQKLFNK